MFYQKKLDSGLAKRVSLTVTSEGIVKESGVIGSHRKHRQVLNIKDCPKGFTKTLGALARELFNQGYCEREQDPALDQSLVRAYQERLKKDALIAGTRNLSKTPESVPAWF